MEGLYGAHARLAEEEHLEDILRRKKRYSHLKNHVKCDKRKDPILEAEGQPDLEIPHLD